MEAKNVVRRRLKGEAAWDVYQRMELRHLPEQCPVSSSRTRETRFAM